MKMDQGSVKRRNWTGVHKNRPVRWESHAKDGGNVKVRSFDCDTLIKDPAGFIYHREKHHLNYVFLT